MVSAIFSYVAVVSDNDGSAFITKAEFDSLKNNFQAQIDNYNQSIDSKIDGAIASYLAGIKVNTDDTPEYKIYGAPYGVSPHKWSGKVANVFYLMGVGTGAWVEKNVKNTSFYAELDTSGYSNRSGYGYAYWVDSLWANKLVTLEPFMGLVTGANLPDGKYFANYKTGGSNPATSHFQQLTVDEFKKCASKLLSDSFETVITLVSPTFPLLDFLDAGEAVVSFGYVFNGGDYEGGKYGRTDTGVALLNNSNGVKIGIQRGSSFLYATSVQSLTDKTWTTLTFDVKPGDQLQCRCDSSVVAASSFGTTCYSIFFFGHDIPGWKIAEP